MAAALSSLGVTLGRVRSILSAVRRVRRPLLMIELLNDEALLDDDVALQAYRERRIAEMKSQCALRGSVCARVCARALALCAV